MSNGFFDDLPFPPSISLYNFKGKRSRLATVVVTRAGFEQRKSVWIFTKRSYDAGMATRTQSQWQQIEDHFEIADGQAIGFPLLDSTDHTVLQSEGLVVPIVGETFCLQRVRMIGSHASYRAFSKLVPGTVKMFRTRSAVTSFVDPSDYALDVTTASGTWATGYRQPGDVFAWLGQFYVPVRYGTNDLDWNVQDKGGGQLLMNGSIPLVEIPIQPLVYIPNT